MPKRVLEVTDGPTGFSARLVIDPKQAPSVTLSYCWGGDQPDKLTKDRLAAQPSAGVSGTLMVVGVH